jgi:hypothetical protein
MEPNLFGQLRQWWIVSPILMQSSTNNASFPTSTGFPTNTCFLFDPSTQPQDEQHAKREEKIDEIQTLIAAENCIFLGRVLIAQINVRGGLPQSSASWHESHSGWM